MSGGIPDEEEEVLSEHNEVMFYDTDTDDTASCNSLETDGSSLYNHREARTEELMAEEFDSQATTLRWGDLFEPSPVSEPELHHGIDTDPANEPFDDHGDSRDGDDQTLALNQSPPDAPIAGSPVEIESVSGLVIWLDSISISPSNSVSSDTPIVLSLITI